MTIPTGQGMSKGPESADGMGNPLPGSRPDRARRNEAANPIVWDTRPKEQGGMGKEDMTSDISYMGSDNRFASDCFGPPPDLASLGDGGQSFGGE